MPDTSQDVRGGYRVQLVGSGYERCGKVTPERIRKISTRNTASTRSPELPGTGCFLTGLFELGGPGAKRCNRTVLYSQLILWEFKTNLFSPTIWEPEIFRVICNISFHVLLTSLSNFLFIKIYCKTTERLLSNDNQFLDRSKVFYE